MKSRVHLILLVAVAALVAASCVRFDVTYLASDALGGRDNGTQGSADAQHYLASTLALFADGVDPAASGTDAYRQPIPGGTNIIGIIPGTDLADEYVLVGGHYDHLSSCHVAEPGDTICNGATDNAAGVAAALSIGRSFGFAKVPPRRSVIVAFWDREEDGLLGSRHFVENPPVPLEDIVGYINFDILGSNLLPSLRDTTFAIAAETGGQALVDAAQTAVGKSALDATQLSSIFGQGRSDYANLIAAGVPSVFFSDSTGPCYHTTGDDVTVVDFDKLEEQIAVATDLAEQLADGSVTPSLDTEAPLAVYGDAAAILGVVERTAPDRSRFTPDQQATIAAIEADLDAIVTAGPAEFGADDVNTTLVGAAQLVSLLTTGECDGFLEPETSGEFDALSYNVAGLPESLSGSSPEANTPLIAPLLNDYDLVLLQESWKTPEPNGLAPLRVYHEILEAGSTHSFQSVPASQPLGTDPSRPTAQLSDGLNRFANFASTPVERVAWTECLGVLDSASDCLAFKGFSHSIIELAPGVEVDVYNLHAEAGNSPEDDALRAQDLAELNAYMQTVSADRPVIVAGDFNLRPDDPIDGPTIAGFIADAGLTDACTALACPDTNTIDRFLYRSSAGLVLTPTLWRFETTTFVDPAGEPLSDHDPLHVRFAWSVPG